MSEVPTPDGLLLRRYRERGDEAAFAELRRRHDRLVLATCRRETGDATLADDAAQGTFLLLTRREFPEDASLAGWLHASARLVSRNLAREAVRRTRRERRAFEEFTEEAAHATPAWNATAPHIDDALEALRAKDREAVLLRFANDLSFAEVGRALGIGENAARMSVTRALDRMRAHLRRTGVGIPVTLLALLLSTRLADAESPPLVRTAPSGSSTPDTPFRVLPLALGVILVGTSVLVGIGVTVRNARLRASEANTSGTPLPPAEREQLLRATEGDWRGTLEYADDRTDARVRTDTNVTVSRNGEGVRLVATYPRFARVDATTIAPESEDRYVIATGGPEGSHQLDGSYRLVRLSDGATAFVGFSPVLGAEVRLRLNATAEALTIQEEYRRGGGYRFRNRFDLRRLR